MLQKCFCFVSVSPCDWTILPKCTRRVSVRRHLPVVYTLSGLIEATTANVRSRPSGPAVTGGLSTYTIRPRHRDENLAALHSPLAPTNRWTVFYQRSKDFSSACLRDCEPCHLSSINSSDEACTGGSDHPRHPSAVSGTFWLTACLRWPAIGDSFTAYCALLLFLLYVIMFVLIDI